MKLTLRFFSFILVSYLASPGLRKSRCFKAKKLFNLWIFKISLNFLSKQVLLQLFPNYICHLKVAYSWGVVLRIACTSSHSSVLHFKSFISFFSRLLHWLLYCIICSFKQQRPNWRLLYHLYFYFLVLLTNHRLTQLRVSFYYPLLMLRSLSGVALRA